MATFDFDFQRYVARRKGAREAAVREGAAYAYGGDLKVLRTLEKLRPVTLAVERTVALWKSQARAELLGTAIRVSDKMYPRVDAAAKRAAAALHIAPPAVYVSAQLPSLIAYTFGTDDDPAIVLHAGLVDELNDLELGFAVARECGHVQNGHTQFRTAHHVLVHRAGAFTRWVVTPAARALGAWARRAEITADRAGLVVGRDVDACAAALVKLIPESALPVVARDEGRGTSDEGEAPEGTRGEGEKDRSPLATRQAALRAFAESAYFRGIMGESGGYPQEACDARVAEILSEGA